MSDDAVGDEVVDWLHVEEHEENLRNFHKKKGRNDVGFQKACYSSWNNVSANLMKERKIIIF